MNPIKAERLRYNLTQEELAAKAGVARGAVADSEVGLYRTPPPSIISYLSQYNPETKARLIKDYFAWVSEERKLNGHEFNVPLKDSFKGYCFAVGGSVRGFCRAAVLQRSIVQDYIKSGIRWNDIYLALSEVGVEPATIRALENLPRD